MNNKGKTATIILGIIVVAFAAIFVVFLIITKPPKLSQEKMQKNVEAAEKAKKENEKQQEEISEDEESSHTGSIKTFQVTAEGTDQSENAIENSETENKETAQGENDVETEAGYLCSYSSERLMTEADVKELKQGTYEELPQGKGIIRMVVNELYAKYGYQFGNEEIQAYFDQKEWYQNISTRIMEMSDIIAKMTDTERANVEFLSPYIEEE